ncbi:nuclear transport factor 2 family protein [Spirillospora sp. NPDC050679]
MDTLETRIALRELVDRYAAGADRRRAREMADMFVEGGELTIRSPGDRPPAVYRGRETIRQAMDGLNVFRVTSHQVHNQLLDFRGDAVTGETYCTAHHVYDTPDGPRMFVMSIRYHDTFAWQGGRWSFAARDLHVDWTEDRPMSLDPAPARPA